MSAALTQVSSGGSPFAPPAVENQSRKTVDEMIREVFGELSSKYQKKMNDYANSIKLNEKLPEKSKGILLKDLKAKMLSQFDKNGDPNSARYIENKKIISQEFQNHLQKRLTDEAAADPDVLRKIEKATDRILIITAWHISYISEDIYKVDNQIDESIGAVNFEESRVEESEASLIESIEDVAPDMTRPKIRFVTCLGSDLYSDVLYLQVGEPKIFPEFTRSVRKGDKWENSMCSDLRNFVHANPEIKDAFGVDLHSEDCAEAFSTIDENNNPIYVDKKSFCTVCFRLGGLKAQGIDFTPNLSREAIDALPELEGDEVIDEAIQLTLDNLIETEKDEYWNLGEIAANMIDNIANMRLKFPE